MDSVPGIILITSCHKHLSDRVRELHVPEKIYCGWPVIIVVGDPNLSDEYTWRPDGILVVRCEDSYYHLLKKIYRTIEIVLTWYNVEQGALVCGDDIIFNFSALEKFLKDPNKGDYIGRVSVKSGSLKKYDPFEVDYFNTHRDDANNPLNGIYGVDISKFDILPNVTNISGNIRYVSMKSIKAMIDFMTDINWNCFHYNEKYGYISICEDLGTGAILCEKDIFPEWYDLDAPNIDELTSGEWVGHTTNKYK